MHKYRDDDLFKDTTMTFGEHLEELRQALFKGLLGLIVGFGIGLYFGKDVVAMITSPLEQALATYYKLAAVQDYETWTSAIPAEKARQLYSVEEIRSLVDDHDWIFEMRFVHADVLRQAISSPPVGADAAAPATDGSTPVARPADESQPEGPAEQSKDVAGPTAVAESPGLAPRADRSVQALVPLVFWQPIDSDARISPKTLSAQEAFSFWMKASLVVGVILSSPWVFYQIWNFVAAGLYPHEKHYVHVFLPFSLGLFLAGAGLAYLFVFQPVLNFLFSFNRSLGLDPDPRISEWLSFVLFLPLGFGISFQLPLVMLFLERIGVFSIKSYIEKWRIAVLVIFVLSAILTPADPTSIFLMALPLTFLYFGGVLLCRWIPRRA